MAKWIEACRETAFSRTFMFTHRRKEIAIFRIEGTLYATANSCSHEYSRLSEGMVIGHDVYCPKHGSRFDVVTGAVKDLPATRPIKTYPVKVEEGVVYVYI